MIEIRNVTRSYGTFKALDDANLAIREGEFFSLLGPSGCGKTTLLRMIAGFDNPTSGSIHVDGQPMDGIPANRRPTNMVFQSYAIFPHLNVEQNVAYGLKRLRLDASEEKRRVEEALAQVSLSGLGKRGATELSGGQRQRVALARALVMRPKVLLLDEPLSALDKKLREQMQVELRRLQQAVGITFVLVTHDQYEALALSDRIAVMFGGRIAQVASPKEIYQRPVNRQVADFLGGMNFMKGDVVETNGATITLDTPGFGRVRTEKPKGFAGQRPCHARHPPRTPARLVGRRQGQATRCGQGHRAALFRRDHPSRRRGSRLREAARRSPRPTISAPTTFPSAPPSAWHTIPTRWSRWRTDHVGTTGWAGNDRPVAIAHFVGNRKVTTPRKPSPSGPLSGLSAQ